MSRRPPALLLGIESSCDELAAAVVECAAAPAAVAELDVRAPAPAAVAELDVRAPGPAAVAELDVRASAPAAVAEPDVRAPVLRVRANQIHGQLEVHRPYGGVVPELASRDHVRSISQVVEAALSEAGARADELGAVAATAGPGLLGSLLVGLCFGKALAFRLGVPFIAVHHLDGHLAAAELAAPELRRPYLGLVVSGGHTALYEVGEARAPQPADSRPLNAPPDATRGPSNAPPGVARGQSSASLDAARGQSSALPDVAHGQPNAPPGAARGGTGVRLLGETRDDAVGEAFDKVARLLGLAYPGGPAVAALAQRGDARAFAFPRPMLNAPGLDFSYSGLKTAVALAVEKHAPLDDATRADLAASFEAAATDVLVARARRAAQQAGLSQIAVVGGVAANARLRASMQRMAERERVRVFFPPPALCTDNAVMVAAAGARLFAAGQTHGFETAAFSRVPLEELSHFVTAPAASLP